MRKGDNHSDTHTHADLESDNKNAPSAKVQNGLFDKAVCITVRNVRKRRADTDGISIKAAIDGIVEEGVLQDDSPKFVRWVKLLPVEISREEKTVITLSVID